VETWRIVATSSFVLGGLMLTLVGMAQVRDSIAGREQQQQGRHDQVIKAGLAGIVMVAIIALLIAFWLPSFITWGIVAATAIAIAFVMLMD
jgi:asparagine N-glycosylation enzyme membrane subunit Stt3